MEIILASIQGTGSDDASIDPSLWICNAGEFPFGARRSLEAVYVDDASFCCPLFRLSPKPCPAGHLQLLPRRFGFEGFVFLAETRVSGFALAVRLAFLPRSQARIDGSIFVIERRQWLWHSLALWLLAGLTEFADFIELGHGVLYCPITAETTAANTVPAPAHLSSWMIKAAAQIK